MILHRWCRKNKISAVALKAMIGVRSTNSVYRYLRHESVPGRRVMTRIMQATGGGVLASDFYKPGPKTIRLRFNGAHDDAAGPADIAHDAFAAAPPQGAASDGLPRAKTQPTLPARRAVSASRVASGAVHDHGQGPDPKPLPKDAAHGLGPKPGKPRCNRKRNSRAPSRTASPA